MARRLISTFGRMRRRGDVRARLRELESIKIHATTERSFFGR